MTAHDASTTLLTAVETLAPVIRHHADEAERQRQLPLPVVQALTDAGLFRMCVPCALGGLEVPPLTFYRVVEGEAMASWGPLWPPTSPPNCLGEIPGWSWPARWLPQAPPRSWRGGIVSAGAGRMRAAASIAPGCLAAVTSWTGTSRA